MSKYITKQGDMWDSISYANYGDVKYTDILIKKNLAYKDVYVFSAGIEIEIPTIEQTSVNKNLPPWKKVNG